MTAPTSPIPPVPPLRTLVARGLRKRCPHCGRGRVFDGWYDTRERCPECGYVLERRAGDSFGFTYVSAAVLTGLYGVVVLFVRPPTNFAESAVYMAFILPIMIGSMPARKGVALALDYWQRRLWPDPDETFPELGNPPDGA